ncbi:MAG: glucose-6-phosphate isomerase [Acidimicrobiia bacterium]|nr:glucose-6-phosphate isomerase [Acidimicrobiia bacterium]
MDPTPALSARLARRDPSLWPEGNVSAGRLGWLDCPSEMRDHAAGLVEWSEEVRASTSLTVLFGMGGSSLAPEMLRATFGGPLRVLDTTHPRTVADALAEAEPAGLALVASKSGTTIEPNAMLAAWRARVPSPARTAAVTDPGTVLDRLATEQGFRAVFRNRPDVGGRYSALSLFGLVPAALLGLDPTVLLDFDEQDLAPGVELGRHLVAEHAARRDKVTFLCARPVATFGLWVEQLLAESTGKRGRGLVPVAGEPPGDLSAYGDDRTFVAVGCGDEDAPGAAALEAAGRPVLRQHLDSPWGLGELCFRWEVATAVVGHGLGVDPFDEPDVAAAKEATARLLDTWPGRPEPGAPPDELPRWLDRTVRPRDHVALCAFLPVDGAVDGALARLQGSLRDRFGVAVTRSFGPRYLHSTGQLHKGGPPTVVVVQLVAGPSAGHETDDDVAVPGHAYGFARLVAAQALGDLEILRSRGRRALRVDLGSDPLSALEALATRP